MHIQKYVVAHQESISYVLVGSAMVLANGGMHVVCNEVYDSHHVSLRASPCQAKCKHALTNNVNE
jgi:hypothetical protein